MIHNQLTTNKNTNASIKNVEFQIGQLSRKIVAHANSNGGFNGNRMDNPKNENYCAIGLRSRMVSTP